MSKVVKSLDALNEDVLGITDNIVLTGSITDDVYNLVGTELAATNGTIQYKTISEDTTFTEALAEGQQVSLRLSDADSYAITWFSTIWIGGSAPTLTAGDMLSFWKESGVVYGMYNGTTIQA